jgi:hypothetical protein
VLCAFILLIMKAKNIEEFAVTYKTAYQISPDDFAVVTPTLKVTKETTVGDILEWFQSGNGNQNPMDVKIVQMMERI